MTCARATREFHDGFIAASVRPSLPKESRSPLRSRQATISKSRSVHAVCGDDAGSFTPLGARTDGGGRPPPGRDDPTGVRSLYWARLRGIFLQSEVRLW